tara:strand:+ start:6349 stop:7329 length:981 start_codon:yes stop_codon:yes gene_type:complete
MKNPFFVNRGPFEINNLLKLSGIENIDTFAKINIFDIKDLLSADKNHLTFFHSKNYETLASNTKAAFCITKKNLANILPKTCHPIISDNVLITTAKITQTFYPDAISDDFDKDVFSINESIFKDNVSFGKNVLIGKNVTIGKDCLIGHNSIIESNVVIGDNCSIGSNVILRNSILKDGINILDGCVIGKKGFGFFPHQSNNIRYPHIGIVIIEDNCEIGCNSTIDRGSLSNTIIGKNTYLDNQVHIAHNNKIGNNCIIAGQVGFAGSSILGNNVMIGGQAGISGHLKIGSNVQIAGGSGVIKDIPDNSKVMGYPAKDLKKFIKDNK